MLATDSGQGKARAVDKFTDSRVVIKRDLVRQQRLFLVRLQYYQRLKSVTYSQETRRLTERRPKTEDRRIILKTVVILHKSTMNQVDIS
jgi:hypothetical protein